VYRVQERLRQLNYYRVGRLDGVDSIEFRDAVAAARKDNGLGDGGLDSAFLTGLYSFGQRPVSASRGAMKLPEAIRYRPEVMAPNVTV
ncbi:peptidoglycan-binding protein, partial [Klebsiella pneumoniae]